MSGARHLAPFSGPTHASSLRPFPGVASRLQGLGGDAVMHTSSEEVIVDLSRERDAVLAVHGRPLVRPAPGHRDPLETGCGRSLPRLPLFLVMRERNSVMGMKAS